MGIEVNTSSAPRHEQETITELSKFNTTFDRRCFLSLAKDDTTQEILLKQNLVRLEKQINDLCRNTLPIKENANAYFSGDIVAERGLYPILGALTEYKWLEKVYTRLNHVCPIFLNSLVGRLNFVATQQLLPPQINEDVKLIEVIENAHGKEDRAAAIRNAIAHNLPFEFLLKVFPRKNESDTSVLPIDKLLAINSALVASKSGGAQSSPLQETSVCEEVEEEIEEQVVPVEERVSNPQRREESATIGKSEILLSSEDEIYEIPEDEEGRQEFTEQENADYLLAKKIQEELNKEAEAERRWRNEASSHRTESVSEDRKRKVESESQDKKAKTEKKEKSDKKSKAEKKDKKSKAEKKHKKEKKDKKSKKKKKS